jgi:hypothetical protein
MGELDLGRAARLLATALLAAFVINATGVVAQVLMQDLDADMLNSDVLRLRVLYSATAVEPRAVLLLGVAAGVLLAVGTARPLLRAIGAAAVGAGVLAAACMVSVATAVDRITTQETLTIGSMLASVVLAAAVAAVSFRSYSSDSSPGDSR